MLLIRCGKYTSTASPRQSERNEVESKTGGDGVNPVRCWNGTQCDEARCEPAIL
jgi:hypothetical protein